MERRHSMYQYQHVLSISDSYFELQNGRHIKIYTLLYIHNVIVRALYFMVVSLDFLRDFYEG